MFPPRFAPVVMMAALHLLHQAGVVVREAAVALRVVPNLLLLVLLAMNHQAVVVVSEILVTRVGLSLPQPVEVMFPLLGEVGRRVLAMVFVDAR